MRMLLIYIFLFLLVPGGIAQRRAIKKKPVPIKEIKEERIFACYSTSSPEAYFKGGHEKWIRFLKKNIRIDSIDEQKLAPPGCQSFQVRFIVDRSGQLSNFTVLDSVHPVFAAEAIRVMRLSPSWEPAVQSGCKVKAYRVQPFTFCIEEDEEDSIAHTGRFITDAVLDSSLGLPAQWFAMQLSKQPIQLLLPEVIHNYREKIAVQFVLHNGVADSLVYSNTGMPEPLKQVLSHIIQTPGAWVPNNNFKGAILYRTVIDVVLDRKNIIL